MRTFLPDRLGEFEPNEQQAPNTPRAALPAKLTPLYHDHFFNIGARWSRTLRPSSVALKADFNPRIRPAVQQSVAKNPGESLETGELTCALKILRSIEPSSGGITTFIARQVKGRVY